MANVPIKLKNIKVNGMEYVCVISETDNNDQLIAECEAKDRIHSIAKNIEKCGSYEALLQTGKEPAKKYLETTKGKLQKYFMENTVLNLLTTKEDLRIAARMVYSVDIDTMLKTANWEDIMNCAVSIRAAFTEKWVSQVMQRNNQMATN